MATKIIKSMTQSTAPTTNNSYNEYEDDDDDDEYEPDGMKEIGLGLGRVSSGGGCHLANQTSPLESFISALPTCHLMTIGFDYTSTNKEKTCYCPCNRRMKKWRSLVSVNIGDGECSAKGRFEKPEHLLQHLKSMKNCKFHEYAAKYLEELYRE